MRPFPPVLVVLLGLSGCIGRIAEGGDGTGPAAPDDPAGAGGGAGGGTGAAAGAGGAPVALPPGRPSAPLRRLSRQQYDNTIRDLLGEGSRPADAFLPEEVLGSFSGSAALARVPAVVVDQYRLAAE